MGRLIVEQGLFAVEVPPHRSLLQVLLERRCPVHHSCRRGLCGQDLIRVRSGMEFLNPVDDNERETLELFGLAAEPVRLACCTRLTGAGDVVIEVVS